MSPGSAFRALRTNGASGRCCLAASGNVLAAISAGVKIIELDPTFDNPLSYVAKVNASRLRDERRAREREEATATAVTLEDSELLRIDKDVPTELTVEHPRLIEILKKFHLDRVQNAMQVMKSAKRA